VCVIDTSIIAFEDAAITFFETEKGETKITRSKPFVGVIIITIIIRRTIRGTISPVGNDPKTSTIDLRSVNDGGRFQLLPDTVRSGDSLRISGNPV